MHLSDKGRAFLEGHEGVVLKAYRDAGGVWTIGAGLTAASGVVKPKAGMILTRGEASALLADALARNYEPAVAKAMPNAQQHEFDGGTSFHFNTGAIGRAKWVDAWRKLAPSETIRAGLNQWIKGGGKVLPGLKRRRLEEADIILLDEWPAGLKPAGIDPILGYAVFVVRVTQLEIEAIREGFRTVGFEPGKLPGLVLLDAVKAFQTKFDLEVDGKIGKATLSTLQRELDARKGVATGAGGVVVGGGGVAGGEAVAPDPGAPQDMSALPPELITWVGIGIGVLAALYLAYLAWHYRDMIAARVAGRAPRLAAWLRSF